MARLRRPLTFLPHESGTERPLRFELIVRPTPEADSVHRRAATARHRVDMVELEEHPSGATLAVFAFERALTTIALPDSAADMCWNATLVRGRARLPRLLRGRELALLELADQGIERAIEHERDISRRDRGPEQ